MAIYIGTKQISNLVSNDLSTSWTTGSSSITVLSDENCFKLTATSTSSALSAYAYQTLATPIPASGIPTSSNYQYIYLQAKVYSPSSNTSYPLFVDSSISSEGGTVGIATLTSYLLGTETATSAALNDGEWHTISRLIPNYTGNKGYQELGFGLAMSESKKNNFIKFKDLIVLDVTSLFGTTPTREECDNEIFINNGAVYLRNSTVKAKIKNLYIGVGGIPKKVLVGYVGVNNNGNNIPKIFFDNRGIRKFFESLTVVTDVSRNRTTASTLSLTYSNYTSGLYYLFSIYYGQLKLYKVKNGTLTLTSVKTPGTTGSVYRSVLNSTWSLSTNGSSAASVNGGALVLTTSNLSEDYVDSLLENIIIYPANGWDSSELATVSYVTQGSTVDYFLPVRYGNIGSTGNVSNRTGFSLWDKNGNKIMQLNDSYIGATYSNGTLSIGDVYGGSIIGFKEVFTFKIAKIKTSANGTPIDFYFPAGENWNNFIISSVNSNSLFAFETSWQTSGTDKLQYNGTYVKYNNSYITRGSYAEIQEFDATAQNYYIAY